MKTINVHDYQVTLIDTFEQPMKRIIKDMRGNSYSANQIHIDNNRVYYAGYRVTKIIKDKSDLRNKHFYFVQMGDFIMGKIALLESDFEIINELLNPIDFTRVNHDRNGNPRFVCHFLAFCKSSDEGSIDIKYQLALKRAKHLGGRKFHNKQYGGGIVFQMYDGEQVKMSKKIKEILNTI